MKDSGIPSSHVTQPSLHSPRPSQASKTQAGTERGVALPGDRGPRSANTETPRPSFWRRIALGGRRVATEVAQTTQNAALQTTSETLPSEAKIPSKSTATAVDLAGVEQRIVEPLLQSLVSIEAKLERSHVDLSNRSDQVEQRLTQLWDIEEQLGTLVEIQESLTHVSEQQRRLAVAIENQTRALRWLVGSIFFSLAAAAFVVAAVVR